MTDLSRKILSDITVYAKYAKYIPELQRRETWEDLVGRNAAMHVKKYPQLAGEIIDNYTYVIDKMVFPSMRALQFSGKPIEICPSRIYNCSFAAIDHPSAFSEAMFLLLGGTGFGFSVQKHHVEKLPDLSGPKNKKRRYLVGDSIEGWADAIKILMEAYFHNKSEPDFDFRDIRPKGAALITSGGKAPGPQPLNDCLHNIKKVLNNALETRGRGTQLKPIEAHDIVCYIADAVLAGGIRRAACISIFSFDDDEMIASKAGAWWELNPQRARANNSAAILRHKITEEEFKAYFWRMKASGSGEPGIFLTNDKSLGINPCSEISLKSNSFCNLTTINGADVTTQEELNTRAKIASFIGTLQAGYTDFHYLRPIWRKTTEDESLLGISITGIATKSLLNLDFEEAARVAVEENKRVAKMIGIKPAKRLTCVKPEGTASLVAGTSAGIHAWHAQHYIRRIRLGKDEALYKYLSEKLPDLLEDEYFNPKNQSVLSIPVKAPDDAILRDEGAISLLERSKKISKEWITPGHISGQNKHNVSITVSVKDEEWDNVCDWLWDNREYYTGITILPYDGGTYVQAPFEDCNEEKYNELLSKISDIDLTEIIEDVDNTDLQGEAACAGGSCSVTQI